ncbi:MULTISPECIES: TetR/AcrR family transcriptional regulator [unclassified Mycolicibacterium]|uniref:TetR/AcrR family transcriptional regulator n=1 Tax=unclassified Mycolicibacterium TaxID=2636767 RepID=UPI0012DE0EE2|nr:MULTISPECIES: TetR/AcrR family transcriptional regulator [unclassified Mycolicibacterium]MUL83517.1 TetR/AcrR family transcriptional regulator [Mycolicibacterium sp. CBMA 329]MUL90508.1 TetR/AcrR family transcriptional regulator [Mycolicibacterium sp. CBMA 331]MUM00480.1 TetR/AcrR family transcriptional regulator [Mycolicibacterium sp. CBMA 334]MUM27714.1 TetR/AcrR family transcriptional regulator [Mycolicibacterium sp. CBMA 295]MUM41452.1 TetR/AcrR family transcriptional regulator [Mycolic
MPRLVDHEERRRAIVQAATRLIGTRGIDSTNMRDLAREAGYTNGALSHYFAGKDEILRAAFENVFEATKERISRSIGARKGLNALRRLAREVMPQTEETRLEARVAVSLWQRALNDHYLAAANDRQLDEWRSEIAGYLRQARENGEIVDVDEDLVANLLMTTMVGMQVTGVLDASSATPAQQDAMIAQILDGISVRGGARGRGKKTAG